MLSSGRNGDDADQMPALLYEYQSRGSAHLHSFLWHDNAPPDTFLETVGDDSPPNYSVLPWRSRIDHSTAGGHLNARCSTTCWWISQKSWWMQHDNRNRASLSFPATPSRIARMGDPAGSTGCLRSSSRTVTFMNIRRPWGVPPHPILRHVRVYAHASCCSCPHLRTWWENVGICSSNNTGATS